jgi:hypothetical protein
MIKVLSEDLHPIRATKTGKQTRKSCKDDGGTWQRLKGSVIPEPSDGKLAMMSSLGPTKPIEF